MSRACRTCTQPITSSEYFLINGSSYLSSSLLIKHLLQSCIPECDLNLAPNSAICKNCTSALHISYCFKRETIKNEEAFRKRLPACINISDVLIKDPLGELEAVNNDESQKEEPLEVELTDISNLKVEFVYDDSNDVEIVTKTEPVVKENVDSAEKGDDVHGSVPIFNEADDSLEKTETEAHLFEEIDTKTEACLLEGTDTDEVSESTENDKSKPDLQNVTSYIQRTSCSSKKMRNVKRPYKCNECNFRSDARAGLRIHKMIHTGEKPFHCTKCSYKAKRKAHLEDHMKIHTGERPYPCPSCDKHFISKQVMKMHQRIHTGEMPYQCKQCNYRARHKSSIANHVKKVHMGITKLTEPQPSVCYICGKCLAGPASLSTHMRIHTGVKSHLCELCGRYFREKGMLKNHLRTHTGEKPFQCSKCDYSATRKAHLQDHMKSHIGRLKLVECNDCGKRYATKILLNKHMKEHHKRESDEETP